MPDTPAPPPGIDTESIVSQPFIKAHRSEPIGDALGAAPSLMEGGCAGKQQLRPPPTELPAIAQLPFPGTLKVYFL